MADYDNRLSVVEKHVHTHQTGMDDMRKDIDAEKKKTSMNTSEIKKTNDILTASHIIQVKAMSMLEGASTAVKIIGKVIAWMIAAVITITGLFLKYG